MLNILSKNKNEFILFDFLFWVLLAIIFPTASGHFSLLNILHIFLYLSATFYVGELLLSQIETIKKIPFLFKSGIYIIFGGIISGLLFLFIPSVYILYLLSFIFFIDLLLSKRILFSFSLGEFLCILPFFVILFQTYELAYATTERYSHSDGDYFFYTAIVESLKTNHSLTNAVYHSGIPINYMALPFLAPAQLAAFSGISSQFALWGVYSKLIPMVCFGTISYTVVKLYEILFVKQLNRRSFIKKQILVAFMFLFLGPLHFLNLVKLDFKNILFLGEGYLLPIGSPGMALSMLFAGLLLLLVFSKQKYSLLHKCTIILFLCIISASKLALFLPLGALLGTLSILWLLKKQPDLFITLLLALPFCILVYKLTVGGMNSIYAPLEFTTNGYYQGFFNDLANKYGIIGEKGMNVLLMMGISVLMWLSIKLLILSVSAFNLRNNYKAVTFIVASIIGLIISALPGFFIRTYEKDAYGMILFDDSFNMNQFVRSSIFLLTISTLVFALYLVYEHKSLLFKKISFAILCLWMITISFSFFSNNYKRPAAFDQSWYKEVQRDFYKQKPGLMAMLGSDNFSGQTLTTAGVHPWFCTGTRGDGDGCIFTVAAYNRNVLFKKIFDPALSFSDRRFVSDSIKTMGVDCIVASPSSLAQIQFAQKDSLVSVIYGTKWLYRLN